MFTSYSEDTGLTGLFNFERLTIFQKNMGLQLSWLERTPDKREVDGSSPFRPTMFFENCIVTIKTLKSIIDLLIYIPILKQYRCSLEASRTRKQGTNEREILRYSSEMSDVADEVMRSLQQNRLFFENCIVTIKTLKSIIDLLIYIPILSKEYLIQMFARSEQYEEARSE